MKDLYGQCRSYGARSAAAAVLQIGRAYGAWESDTCHETQPGNYQFTQYATRDTSLPTRHRHIQVREAMVFFGGVGEDNAHIVGDKMFGFGAGAVALVESGELDGVGAVGEGGVAGEVRVGLDVHVRTGEIPCSVAVVEVDDVVAGPAFPAGFEGEAGDGEIGGEAFALGADLDGAVEVEGVAFAGGLFGEGGGELEVVAVDDRFAWGFVDLGFFDFAHQAGTAGEQCEGECCQGQRCDSFHDWRKVKQINSEVQRRKSTVRNRMSLGV